MTNDQTPGRKYSRLLADPRWQKLAAEIKNRDGWMCLTCGNGLEDGVPLEVHHRAYTATVPWEEPPENLETRCANCHGKDPLKAWSLEEVEARARLFEQKYSALNREAVELLEDAREFRRRVPRKVNRLAAAVRSGEWDPAAETWAGGDC